MLTESSNSVDRSFTLRPTRSTTNRGKRRSLGWRSMWHATATWLHLHYIAVYTMLLGCVRAVYRANIFEINFFNAFVDDHEPFAPHRKFIATRLTHWHNPSPFRLFRNKNSLSLFNRALIDLRRIFRKKTRTVREKDHLLRPEYALKIKFPGRQSVYSRRRIKSILSTIVNNAYDYNVCAQIRIREGRNKRKK